MHYLFFFSLFFLTFSSQSHAIRGVCPELNSHTDSYMKRILRSDNWRRSLYFCKQEFSDNSLTFQPSEDSLMQGGSQSISKGNKSETVTLNSSINLSGFTVEDLTLNSLQANLPSENGAFDSPSLFNFYKRIPLTRECNPRWFNVNRFNEIRDELRQRANIFQVTSGGFSQGFVADNTNPNGVAKIENALLTHSVTGKQIPAKIYLYHANNKAGQYFTRRYWRYCWYGLAVRIEINLANAVELQAGEYDFSLHVNTL